MQRARSTIPNSCCCPHLAFLSVVKYVCSPILAKTTSLRMLNTPVAPEKNMNTIEAIRDATKALINKTSSFMLCKLNAGFSTFNADGAGEVILLGNNKSLHDLIQELPSDSYCGIFIRAQAIDAEGSIREIIIFVSWTGPRMPPIKRTQAVKLKPELLGIINNVSSMPDLSDTADLEIAVLAKQLFNAAGAHKPKTYSMGSDSFDVTTLTQ